MNETLSSALLLMAVGMITVFVILLIVVFSGNLLIRLVNKYSVETTKLSKDSTISSIISQEHIAVISALSNDLAQGQAHSLKIEKL